MLESRLRRRRKAKGTRGLNTMEISASEHIFQVQAQKGWVIKVKSSPEEEFEQKDLRIFLKHSPASPTNVAVTSHSLGERMSQ